MTALAALRLPLLHGITAAAVTAVFVAWFTQSVLREADLTSLTLNVLLRGSDPFLGKPLAHRTARGSSSSTTFERIP